MKDKIKKEITEKLLQYYEHGRFHTFRKHKSYWFNFTHYVAVMSYNIFVTSSYTLGLHHFLTNPTIQYSKLGSILNPKTFWVISLVFILLTDVDALLTSCQIWALLTTVITAEIKETVIALSQPIILLDITSRFK